LKGELKTNNNSIKGLGKKIKNIKRIRIKLEKIICDTLGLNDKIENK